jgi:hypothetical protein
MTSRINPINPAWICAAAQPGAGIAATATSVGMTVVLAGFEMRQSANLVERAAPDHPQYGFGDSNKCDSNKCSSNAGNRARNTGFTRSTAIGVNVVSRNKRSTIKQHLI